MSLTAKREQGSGPAPPAHIAIIMDGNGRWAEGQGLSRLAGHESGSRNVRRIIQACIERRVRYLTLFAFSTENWSRSAEEVTELMSLVGRVIDRDTMGLHRDGVQLRHLGRIGDLPAELQEKLLEAIELTSRNRTITVTVALNYGGRSDIVEAVKALVASGIAPESITEETVNRHLGTRGLPDPDLIIRTSGERRFSNFLLWQAAYSEFWTTEKPWPDFSPSELDLALSDYAVRDRRFGGAAEVAQASPARDGS